MTCLDTHIFKHIKSCVYNIYYIYKHINIGTTMLAVHNIYYIA